jgi:dihydroorotate dehydrogenase
MEPGGVLEPFYDPGKTYEENFEQGPFGLFAEAGDNKQEQKQIPFPPHRAKNARRGPGFGNDKKEGNDKEKNKQQSHRFLGMSVDAPFGVPAGPLLNGRFVKAALDWGFDIPVYKTVRTRRYACHAWPNVLAVKVDGDLHVGRRLVAGQDYGEPLSITNSFGVPSYDPAFWQPDMADAARHARPGQMVVGSFQGTRSEGGSVAEYVADFALAARLVKETGVHAMEVNLSCPNEGTGNLLCFDAARSRAVLEAIRQEIGDVPLVIKMAYYQREDGDARLEAFVREVGGLVDGIAAINTVSAEIVDEHGRQALPGEGRLRSGVCGEAIRWAGLEMTQRLAQLRERLGMRFEIVGVGGVGDAAAFDAYRRAGADAVMSATAAMWNPRLAIEVKERSHEL